MKILIVSDTHRQNGNYFKVVEQQRPDLVIHCGDVEGCEDILTESAGCPVRIVPGNNDFFSMLDREREIEIVGHKILLTHGHYYGVSMGPEGLADEARSRGCDMAMFGHTHKPFLGEIGGVMVLNPGSLSYPRQEGRRPSYMIMTVEEGKDVRFQIKNL